MSRSVVVLRLLVLLGGGSSLWVALPSSVDLPIPLVLALLSVGAIAPAIFPGTWVPLLVEVLAVLGWVFRTGVLAEDVHVIPLLVLAVGLYAHHTLCALAAVVPGNAVLTPPVFGQWLLRSVPALLAAVLGVALAVALAPNTTMPPVLPDLHNAAPLPLILLALLLVPLLVGIPVRMMRR